MVQRVPASRPGVHVTEEGAGAGVAIVEETMAVTRNKREVRDEIIVCDNKIPTSTVSTM